MIYKALIFVGAVMLKLGVSVLTLLLAGFIFVEFIAPELVGWLM